MRKSATSKYFVATILRALCALYSSVARFENSNGSSPAGRLSILLKCAGTFHFVSHVYDIQQHCTTACVRACCHPNHAGHQSTPFRYTSGAPAGVTRGRFFFLSRFGLLRKPEVLSNQDLRTGPFSHDWYRKSYFVHYGYTRVRPALCLVDFSRRIFSSRQKKMLIVSMNIPYTIHDTVEQCVGGTCQIGVCPSSVLYHITVYEVSYNSSMLGFFYIYMTRVLLARGASTAYYSHRMYVGRAAATRIAPWPRRSERGTWGHLR